VTPLRGVIRGGGSSHRLVVAVHTRLLDAAADKRKPGPPLASENRQETLP
jgi:hypothetical protein